VTLPILEADEDEIKIIGPQNSRGNESFDGNQSHRIKGSFGGTAPTIIKRAIKENPKNIRIRGGQRMPLSERFPGFFRMDNGALWFHNQEGMTKQAEYFLEAIQKSGKTLMDGRDIVTVSLPV
jgi:hypothetical protein